MDEVRVLEFRGEIDMVAKRRIERKLGQIAKFGDASLTILDLTKVAYLDTTFLNALMRVSNRLAKEKPNARICLVVPRGGIARHLFEITEIDATFKLFENVPSAIRHGFSALPSALPASA